MIKNTLWNIFGLVVPSLIAIPALAVLSRQIGPEAFGVFLMIFAMLGFASIFDAGLSRSVTRAVAINGGEAKRNATTLKTATMAALVGSSIASLLLFAFSTRIAEALNVSAVLFDETDLALRIASAAVVPYILSLVWLSYLEGNQQFAAMNLYKSIIGSSIALLPPIICLASASLPAAVLGILLSRVLAVGLSFIPARACLLAKDAAFSTKELKNLLKFGGWLTVSNTISPIMAYFDRFLLSGVSGALLASTYAACAEFITRMAIIPGAAARALFPRLSADSASRVTVARKTRAGIALITVSMAAVVFMLSEQILSWWLGPEIGHGSAALLQILLVGFVFNSVAQVPFSYIQALGLSRTTALLHLGELLPYLAILYYGISHFGALGAAAAWTLRMAADYVLLEIVARRAMINSTASRLEAGAEK